MQGEGVLEEGKQGNNQQVRSHKVDVINIDPVAGQELPRPHNFASEQVRHRSI